MLIWHVGHSLILSGIFFENLIIKPIGAYVQNLKRELIPVMGRGQHAKIRGSYLDPSHVGWRLTKSATHTATHAATHTETHTATHTATRTSHVGWRLTDCSVLLCSAVCCCFLHTLQYTATHCNTLQHTATHCNTLAMLDENSQNLFDENSDFLFLDKDSENLLDKDSDFHTCITLNRVMLHMKESRHVTYKWAMSHTRGHGPCHPNT